MMDPPLLVAVSKTPLLRIDPVLDKRQRGCRCFLSWRRCTRDSVSAEMGGAAWRQRCAAAAWPCADAANPAACFVAGGRMDEQCLPQRQSQATEPRLHPAQCAPLHRPPPPTAANRQAWSTAAPPTTSCSGWGAPTSCTGSRRPSPRYDDSSYLMRAMVLAGVEGCCRLLRSRRGWETNRLGCGAFRKTAEPGTAEQRQQQHAHYRKPCSSSPCKHPTLTLIPPAPIQPRRARHAGLLGRQRGGPLPLVRAVGGGGLPGLADVAEVRRPGSSGLRA
jgi:hypothetical protein